MKNLILKYKVTIGALVLVIVFGVGYWVLGNPGPTTIGEDIDVGGELCFGPADCRSSWPAGGGVSYTYYCFTKDTYGTPVCANAGGSQGYCPPGYTQKLALGLWGHCYDLYAPENKDHFFLPPSGSCGPGYRTYYVVGSAYVCSQ